MKKSVKKAGIHGKVGTHTMRKTAAWQSYKIGGVASAQKILNHSSPTETMLYLGLNKVYVQEAYEDIDKKLSFYDFI
jgi:integrase